MSTTVTELCRTTSLVEASYAQRLVEKYGLRLRPDLFKTSVDVNKDHQKQRIVEFITAKNLSINQC
ncbi:hypothetical protein [Nostoc sp.]|uniref:hypothetical protein n=1 Tax=Nostoc sp. TaxID=1180 RepID=UPI002FF8B852